MINLKVNLLHLFLQTLHVHSAPPPFKRGETKFWKSQKGWEDLKKIGVGETKRGGFKMKGGTQLLKLNLGIEKGKIGTFRDKLAYIS